MSERQAKRPCPRCGNPVHAFKSTTVSSDWYHATRLQNIHCLVCGMRGTVQVEESVEWLGLSKSGQICQGNPTMDIEED